MARKSLGQHFLVDEGVIELIVATIAARRDDAMVEIGPGRGALTWPLLQQLDRLHAIEIDRQLGRQLQQQSDQHHRGLHVHHADALSFDYVRLGAHKPLRLVGNLPYNMASPLLFHLFATMECIKDMHFMLQTEVAQRLVARPGQPAYSRMSIMAACCARAECLFGVEADAFSPAPKVKSTFVKIVPHARLWPAHQYQRLERLVKKMFATRRKTVRQIFAGQCSEPSLLKAGIPPLARPGDLHLDQLLALVQLLKLRHENDEHQRRT